MLRRILQFFHRYEHQHGALDKPGFPLFDENGGTVGHIDRLGLRHGRLEVEGWAVADRVCLVRGTERTEKEPDIPRPDVAGAHGPDISPTPGFRLDLPLGEGACFFVRKTGNQEVAQPVDFFSGRERRAMRRALVMPFVASCVRAVPAAFGWYLHRDPKYRAQVKAILGFGQVERHETLTPFLFAEDCGGQPEPHPDLMQTGITIVLPVYNALDLLPEVLDRIGRHTDLPYRLIVVEDCSSDPGVRPFLHDWHAALGPERRDRVEIIENAENLGFIRSVNAAFERALALGDHVVLLNSDAFVPAGWASRLIRPLLEHERVASVTPMSNDAEIFTAPVICRKQDLKPGEADAIDATARRFVPDAALKDAPTGVGFCMAIHREALRALPVFDTVFGKGYGEEVDWCRKLAKAGWRHLGHGGLYVEHRGGTSFGSAAKAKLVARNNAIVSQRHEGYDQLVQDFILRDTLAGPRLALALAWAAERQAGPVPVYMAHALGGGAEHYLQDRIAEDIARDAAAVVLRVGGDYAAWRVELHCAAGVVHGDTDHPDFVRRLLDILPRRQVVYSNGAGAADMTALPDMLCALAEGEDHSLDMLFHDYLPLSPSYTLLGKDGRYAGLPAADESADPAHDYIRPDGQTLRLAEWRETWGKAMRAADHVTVFSQTSRDLVLGAYPDVAGKTRVVPHSLATDLPRVAPGAGRDGKPVIGVLGALGWQKGVGIVQELSTHLAWSEKGQMALIGYTDPNYTLDPSTPVHGPYEVRDIPTLVKRYGITCWFIPSIWPETFSYTTHEAIATGLPVWTFDIGAQGEAAARAAQATGQGGTIPLADGPVDVAEVADTILASHRPDPCTQSRSA